MNKIEELKADAEKKLEEALKKQQAIIDAQKMLIDSYEKLKVGNIIIQKNHPSATFLIVDDSQIDDEGNITIPVRHHIYPEISNQAVSLNMSGVVDPLVISVNDLDELESMSVSQYIRSQKNGLRDKLSDRMKRIKQQISYKEREIKQFEKDIEFDKKLLDEYESFNIDVNLDAFIINYVHSDKFKKLTFENVRCSKYPMNLI